MQPKLCNSPRFGAAGAADAAARGCSRSRSRLPYWAGNEGHRQPAPRRYGWRAKGSLSRRCGTGARRRLASPATPGGAPARPRPRRRRAARARSAAPLALLLHRAGAAAIVAAAALAITLLALAAPLTLYRRLRGALDRLGHWVGTAVTWALMTLLFYLLFLPVGLVLRATGKLAFTRFADPGLDSYWTPTDGAVPGGDSYRKQF
jgi:hypothetical protein